MKLSDCKSLEDVKHFREGSGEGACMWTISKGGWVTRLCPTEYHITSDYSCDKFIWQDNNGKSRYEDLYNSEREAEKIAYLRRVRRAQEVSDKAREELDWLLANPPKDD